LRKRVDQGIRRFHACSFSSSFFFIKDPLNKGFLFIHLQQKDVIFGILHDFVVNRSFSVVVHRCHSSLPTTKRNTRRGGEDKNVSVRVKEQMKNPFWNNEICLYHYVPCSRLLSAKHPCVSATAIVSKRETWEGRLYHKDSGRRLSLAARVPVTKE